MIGLISASVGAALSCAGVVIGHKAATCTPMPPLVAPCAAVKACSRTGACVITVTGKVTAAEFSEGEAWGDWQQRLRDAPAGVVAAAVPRLSGRAIAATPYTIYFARGRKPLVADGLPLDDLGWLTRYSANGSRPEGLRTAPADVVARLCPSHKSRPAPRLK